MATFLLLVVAFAAGVALGYFHEEAKDQLAKLRKWWEAQK